MQDSLKIVVACIGLVCAAPAPAAAQTPLINEFMGSNATTIADDDGDYSDWLELYNPGAATFDLTGCYLSDDAGNPLRWQFPGGSIPPQGYLLVWASGKDRQSPGGELHTNFAISAGGEPLLLTAADGTTRLDEAPPHALTTDISYGRLPDGAVGWMEFAVATPAASNSAGLLYLDPPIFSQTPGFFASAISLAVIAPDPEAVIRYTLDGSEPTPASAVYTEPLVLDNRAGDPNTISLIPTNFQDSSDFYGWRPPRGEIFKLHVIRARTFRAGHAPSAITTGSYIIDRDLTGQIPLAVVSLATAPENLFADDIGIYVPGNTYVPGNLWSGNYFQESDAWERPIHIELFDRQGNLLLAQDAGARIHGGVTRFYPQKSLRLLARSLYGPARFDAALFPDLPYESYNCILVRNSGNDWGQRGFRDFLSQTMVANMGFDTQAGRPVIHFINGEYWGIANLRERYDRHYVERVYGVPADQVAIMTMLNELEEGSAADRLHYLNLYNYIAYNNLTSPEALMYVAESMDLENFAAYQIAEIYLANLDWPGNNIRYWRRSVPEYDPTAPYGHDGRWRWMMYDVDHALFSASYNMLAQATAGDGPSWPNPPWSTLMLRRLLENAFFRRAFINTFADHLNSTFVPARLIGYIDEFASLYAPAIEAWQYRWDVTYNWASGVQYLRNVVTSRPAYQRQQLIDHFELDGATTVTLNVNDPARGKIQLNSLVIDGALAGLADPAQPYPWSGIYFQGVPITVTALPAPGSRFVAWQGIADSNPTLTVIPSSSSLSLTAVFEIDQNPPVPLHAWHFNDLPSGTLTAVAADVSVLGGAVITYPGTGAGYLDRVSPGTDLGALPDTPAGYGLRARNPSDTRELVLTVPSTGHRDLELRYAVTRTVNGAQEHSVWCQTAGDGAWLPLAEHVAVTEQYALWSYNLATVEGAADNPDLRVKFTFGGTNAPGSEGNQRFDNVTLLGVPISGAQLPPVVSQPVALQAGYEECEPLVLDLDEVFLDPNLDPLVFTAASDDSGVAAVAVDGHELTIVCLGRGDARVTVTADDGHFDPVPHVFRVLVYPAAAVLADGAFAFGAWDPDLPERTYPEHMLFLQSEVSDPILTTPLLYPYFIPHDDYHADDQGTIGFPYNNTGRTRLNGLGDDGISFINTGRGRDLGAALLALDTRGVDEVTVAWLGGTIVPNDRIYAIRLQYRIGHTGEFQDVVFGGQPVEYQRSETAGDTEEIGPISLPSLLRNQAYVQLQWRYYHMSGEAGPRPELRLDDILVGGNPVAVGPEPALPALTALHGNAPNPFNPVTVIRFSVREGERARLDVYNGRGQRVRSLGSFPAGRHRATWDGTDAGGQRCASGMYFVRLAAPAGAQTLKALLVK